MSMELLFSFVTIFSWSHKSRKSQTIHHKSREIRIYKMFAMFRETSVFSFNFFWSNETNSTTNVKFF